MFTLNRILRYGIKTQVRGWVGILLHDDGASNGRTMEDKFKVTLKVGPRFRV